MSTHHSSRLWSSHTANWLKLLPTGPTAFELKVKRLGLANSPEKWTESPRLREWVKLNKNRRYVPEWLLDAYGLKGFYEGE
jgi:hypothetical protein